MQRFGRVVSVILVTAIAGVLSLATVQLVVGATEGVAEPRVEERVRATEASAQALRAWFGQLILDARRAAEQLAGSPLDAPATAVLDSMTAASPVFDHGYVTSMDGRVTAASASAAGLVGLERRSVLIEQALTAGHGISGVVSDPFLREAAVEVAVPIGDPARGVLVGISRLDSGGLPAALELVPFATSARVAVVGPDDTVVRPGAQPDSAERVGPNLTLPSRQATTGAGYVEFEAEAGVETIATFAPISDGWRLVVYEDAASFSPTAEGVRAGLAALPGLVALSTLLVVGFVTLDTRARRRVAEAEQTKRAFLAVTGHELRTPLTVLSGTIETLDRAGTRVREEFREQSIRTMAVQVRKLDLLIERLIFVSHLESGVDIGVRPAKVDIAPMLERVAEEQRAAWPLHTLVTDIEAPLQALADPSALRQVLRHLLENAARYSPSGGEIRLIGRSSSRAVEIHVEDDGVGLPSDSAHIFDKFVQGETVDTRLRDEGGLGLGLYIVKTLTEAMSGSVRAGNTRQGARFTVSLRGT